MGKNKVRNVPHVAEEIFKKAHVLKLCNMMSYMRPSRKQSEPHYAQFLNTFIQPVMGDHDGSYNYIHIVTSDSNELNEHNMPRIAYMAHHDTVHSVCGDQSSRLKYYLDKKSNVQLFVDNKSTSHKETYTEKLWDPVEKKLNETEKTRTITKPVGEQSNCLGADCTVGVWLILEMILANVPGVYVIHNDEEIGRVGAELIVSKYKTTKKQITDIANFPISKYRPVGLENGWEGMSFDERREILPYYFWIDYVDIAMSFDRKDYHSIITKQRGSTTASDSFADSFSAIISPDLVAAGYPALKADPTGSFTDSASYDKLISECTNISVGYFDQHTRSEMQDFTFAVALRNSLIKNGASLNNKTVLIASRDPIAVETYTPSRGIYTGGKPYTATGGYGSALNDYPVGGHTSGKSSFRYGGFSDFDDLDDFFNVDSYFHKKDSENQQKQKMDELFKSDETDAVDNNNVVKLITNTTVPNAEDEFLDEYLSKDASDLLEAIENDWDALEQFLEYSVNLGATYTGFVNHYVNKELKEGVQ